MLWDLLPQILSPVLALLVYLSKTMKVVFKFKKTLSL